MFRCAIRRCDIVRVQQMLLRATPAAACSMRQFKTIRSFEQSEMMRNPTWRVEQRRFECDKKPLTAEDVDKIVSAALAKKPHGNPGVVGLAGFSVSALLLQAHNLGWCTVGPVLPTALVFGGIAQLVAGFQEYQNGNNFGYSAFCTFGCFWIIFAMILLNNHFKIYPSTSLDVGYFLLAFTIYTGLTLPSAMAINAATALLFWALFMGFVFLDVAHFYPNTNEWATKVASWDLIFTAFVSFYCMFGALYAENFGRVILPMGKALLK